MPSQNLPKPNLPGQNQPEPKTLNSAAAAPSIAPTAPATQSTQPIQPAQLNSTTLFDKNQPSPGMLSRENPAGAPPKMPNIQARGPLSQPSLSSQPSSSQQLASLRPAAPKLSAPQLPNNQAATPAAPATLTQPSSSSSLGSPTPSTPPAPKAPQLSQAPQSNSTAPQAPATPPPATTKKATLFSKIPKPLLFALLAIVGIGLIVTLLSSLGVIGGKKSTAPTASSNPNGSLSETNSATANNPGESISITYWGLWEDSQVLKEILSDFESKTNIKVDYRKQSHRDYRERLQQAIASGNGPDVFRFHASWVPMLATELAAMPSSVMSSSDYQKTFYPSAYTQLQLNGQIVGVPLMYDGLALLYNKEMLKTANLTVPSTWSDLRTAANKLTVPSNPSDRKAENITRGGLAIGNAGNVEHFSDILGLLILQNGGSPADPSTQYVEDALTFYTNFMKQDKVWSDRLPSSSVAFARGEAAMIFAPSWRIHEIKNLNPELDFGVAPAPQLSADQTIAWSTFWAEGVNKQSKKQAAAWQFLDYLSSIEVLQKFYSDASLVRPFGEIYPRTDMASSLSSDPLVGAYLEDAPYAKSWYLASFTHDNGLNDQMIKYYEDAVNGFLTGGNAEKTIQAVSAGVKEVLSKYGLK